MNVSEASTADRTGSDDPDWKKMEMSLTKSMGEGLLTKSRSSGRIAS